MVKLGAPLWLLFCVMEKGCDECPAVMVVRMEAVEQISSILKKKKKYEVIFWVFGCGEACWKGGFGGGYEVDGNLMGG
jgi:hypothetical protein